MKRKPSDQSLCEVHEKQPEGFDPQVKVAACYIEIDNKLLLLQSTSEKLEPAVWGVPAGKLEKNETPENGARRELFEETGISIEHSSQIQSLGALYIRKPEVDFIYYFFKVHLDKLPQILLSNEHQSFRWVSPQEMEEIPLMAGAQEALKSYRAALVKKRAGASVNGYLVLKQDNKILLHLRRNTGYCDGMWSFVAGHVEDGESATAGMIREAYEEIGIQLLPSQIKVVHVMHRKTNRLNVDIFFDCQSWHGKIKNREPEKCERLEFFPLERLPSNMIDYNAAALQSILRGELYSERGWD